MDGAMDGGRNGRLLETVRKKIFLMVKGAGFQTSPDTALILFLPIKRSLLKEAHS